MVLLMVTPGLYGLMLGSGMCWLRLPLLIDALAQRADLGKVLILLLLAHMY